MNLPGWFMFIKTKIASAILGTGMKVILLQDRIS